MIAKAEAGSLEREAASALQSLNTPSSNSAIEQIGAVLLKMAREIDRVRAERQQLSDLTAAGMGA